MATTADRAAVFSAGRDTLGVQPVRISQGRYLFKRAETTDEFDRIHRLNHETFVREVGQYADDGSGVLVDKFHEKNVYFLALDGDRLVGMIAVHDSPPFSTAGRLRDPTLLDRLGDRLLEVRLLAVRPEARHGSVFAGLGWMLCEHALAAGHSHLLIAGLLERRRLYERLGFRDLGPPVRSGQAWYVPMASPVAAMPRRITEDIARMRRKTGTNGPSGVGVPSFAAPQRQDDRCVSFLPGPVPLSRRIRRAFTKRLLSHRDSRFATMFARVRRLLTELTGAPAVAVMSGGGTLANDAMGATLAADASIRRGLILSNGEFGSRLAAQARRFGLDFEVLEWPWGRPWNVAEVERAVRSRAGVNWLWGVHLETSTGVLNDLPALVELGRRRGLRVCMDCVSSLGAVPLDLGGVHLASGVSGKSLGAVAGLSFVLAGGEALARVDASRTPTYLDVRAAIESERPRFTLPSPQMQALDTALVSFATDRSRDRRYAHLAALGRMIRGELRDLGIRPLAEETNAAPVITSFRPEEDSAVFLSRYRGLGFELHGASGYLRERNLVQIATMGAIGRRHCRRLFVAMKRWNLLDGAAGDPDA